MKFYKYLFLIAVFPLVCGFANIAHRGDNGLGRYAEHSFLAYDSAIVNGADYIELDLQKTKDNVLVVSHDDNLSRVFGVNLDIGKTDYQTLSKYRNQSGEKMHTLKSVFQRYQGDPRVKFMLETKNENAPVGMEHELVKLIKAYHLEKRILFESFSLQSLALLKKLAPSIPRTVLGGDYHNVGNNQYFADGMYSPLAAKYLAKHNRGYIIWGVDQLKTSQKLVNNPLVSGVMTDFASQLGRLNRNQDFLLTHKIQGQVRINSPFAVVENSYQIFKEGSLIDVSAITRINGQLYYELMPGQYLSSDFVNLAHPKEPITETGFLFVKKNTPVYPVPSDAAISTRSLRPNSRWNYYAYVTKNEGSFYNLGGNQWIKGDDVLKAHSLK